MPVQLIDATLPDFGVPATRPELPRSTYLARLDALHKARRAASIDSLVIFADREHSANLAWLTGFDPRFEEALLIVAPGQTPTLLAGPENLGRAQKSAIEVEARLYPPFGLMGQDRSQTPDLEEVLTSAGVARNQRVGVLGWKYYGAHESPRPDSWFETPAFIIDTLRQIVGPEGRVVNANALLMDSSTGLRAVNEIEQIAQFEFGAVDGLGSAEGAVSQCEARHVGIRGGADAWASACCRTRATPCCRPARGCRPRKPVGQDHRARRSADHRRRLLGRPVEPRRLAGRG